VGQTSAQRARLTPRDVELTLAGDVQARRSFVTKLLPVVHARVARTILRRRGGQDPVALRERVADFSQDVFEHLFQKDARALRGWDPDRGLSVENYVGMIAEQRVAAALRTRRRNPWTEEPTCADHLAAVIPPQASPDRQVMARQLLERLQHEVRASLTPRGQDLFERLVVDKQPVATVCEELGMSTAAVHAWSSRLKRRVRDVLETLGEEPIRKTGAS
jgi:RNA polymerase sigma-70 factor, ECF subfamily